jgi:pimeloyl-ACP methyl ester carboxylesterase
LDWPEDVAQLADHLGLQRFAVEGESGGGPHALALAYALPERITTAVVLAGMGPADDPRVVEGMNRLNKLLFRSALHAPWLLRLCMWSMAKSVADPAKSQKYMRKRAAAAPAADREAFMQPELLAALSEALRQGSRAASDEMALFAKPWGFRIEDITVHVDLFHGEQDTNVPFAIARSVAARLPNCTARMLPEYGHAVGFYVQDEVMQCVRNAA